MWILTDAVMEYNLDYAIARLQNSQIFWNARVLQALFERQSKQDVYYMEDEEIIHLMKLVCAN